MVPPASLALTRLTPGFAGPSPHGEGRWLGTLGDMVPRERPRLPFPSGGI